MKRHEVADEQRALIQPTHLWCIGCIDDSSVRASRTTTLCGPRGRGVADPSEPVNYGRVRMTGVAHPLTPSWSKRLLRCVRGRRVVC